MRDHYDQHVEPIVARVMEKACVERGFEERVFSRLDSAV
jgi:hypothetical protein